MPLPADYRAMYWNHDGLEIPAVMTWQEMAVFLDYCWEPMHLMILVNKVSRSPLHRAAELVLTDRLGAFSSWGVVVSLELKPALAVDGAAPLMAMIGPKTAVEYLAFDSCLALVRRVVAAQKAGIIRYDAEKRISYPLGEILSVVRQPNPRETYWTALAKNEVDWKFDEQPRHGPFDPARPWLIAPFPK